MFSRMCFCHAQKFLSFIIMEEENLLAIAVVDRSWTRFEMAPNIEPNEQP